MDAQTKALSSQRTSVVQSTNASCNRLTPDDSNHKSGQHLTIVKYLPVSVFSSPLTLTQSLDSIYKEIRSLDTTNMRNMLINLANNIAITTTDLHTDYKSKLDLIHAAYHHRIFNNKNLLIKALCFVANKVNKKKYRSLFKSDAQSILHHTITSSKLKKDCIILC